MKYVWVVMAAFFFGLGAGLLLCNSTISHLRRRLRALRLNGDQGKKTETMKKVVWDMPGKRVCVDMVQLCPRLPGTGADRGNAVVGGREGDHRRGAGIRHQIRPGKPEQEQSLAG